MLERTEAHRACLTEHFAELSDLRLTVNRRQRSLDMTFRDDESRTRERTLAENCAMKRRKADSRVEFHSAELFGVTA